MVQNRNNVELEIILALLKGNYHLRELSRKLETPHATILRKLNEFVKENILDFKTEGKNKIFFVKNSLNAKNQIYSAEIYKLSKLIKKHPELEIIFEEIKKVVPKGMIILFGSYAKGNEKKESDIDIYIESTDNSLKNKLKEISSKINPKFGKFDRTSLLIKEIIKNHVTIRGVEEFYEKIKFFE